MTHNPTSGCNIRPRRRLRLARNSHARALSREASRSLARRRLRLSQAKGRSTSQRRGRTTKPAAGSERFTSSPRPRLARTGDRITGRCRCAPSDRGADAPAHQYGTAVHGQAHPAGALPVRRPARPPRCRVFCLPVARRGWRMSSEGFSGEHRFRHAHGNEPQSRRSAQRTLGYFIKPTTTMAFSRRIQETAGCC